MNITSSCSSWFPYGIFLLTVLYGAFVALILSHSPKCEDCTDDREDVQQYTVLDWSSDYFLSVILALMSLSFCCLSSKPLPAAVSFLCWSLGYASNGIAKQCGNISGAVDQRAALFGYYTSMIVTYIIWSLAILVNSFFLWISWRVLIDQYEIRPRYGSFREVRLFVFLIMGGTALVVTGCSFSMFQNGERESDHSVPASSTRLIDIGRHVWHAGTIFFFLTAAMIWRAHALVQPASIGGLSNLAVAIGLFFTQLAAGVYRTVLWVSEQFIPQGGFGIVHDIVATVVLQYTALITLFFVHNLLCTIFPRFPLGDPGEVKVRRIKKVGGELSTDDSSDSDGLVEATEEKQSGQSFLFDEEIEVDLESGILREVRQDVDAHPYKFGSDDAAALLGVVLVSSASSSPPNNAFKATEKGACLPAVSVEADPGNVQVEMMSPPMEKQQRIELKKSLAVRLLARTVTGIKQEYLEHGCTGASDNLFEEEESQASSGSNFPDTDSDGSVQTDILYISERLVDHRLRSKDSILRTNSGRSGRSERSGNRVRWIDQTGKIGYVAPPHPEEPTKLRSTIPSSSSSQKQMSKQSMNSKFKRLYKTASQHVDTCVHDSCNGLLVDDMAFFRRVGKQMSEFRSNIGRTLSFPIQQVHETQPKSLNATSKVMTTVKSEDPIPDRCAGIKSHSNAQPDRTTIAKLHPSAQPQGAVPGDANTTQKQSLLTFPKIFSADLFNTTGDKPFTSLSKDSSTSMTDPESNGQLQSTGDVNSSSEMQQRPTPDISTSLVPNEKNNTRVRQATKSRSTPSSLPSSSRKRVSKRSIRSKFKRLCKTASQQVDTCVDDSCNGLLVDDIEFFRRARKQMSEFQSNIGRTLSFPIQQVLKTQPKSSNATSKVMTTVKSEDPIPDRSAESIGQLQSTRDVNSSSEMQQRSKKNNTTIRQAVAATPIECIKSRTVSKIALDGKPTPQGEDSFDNSRDEDNEDQKTVSPDRIEIPVGDKIDVAAAAIQHDILTTTLIASTSKPEWHIQDYKDKDHETSPRKVDAPPEILLPPSFQHHPEQKTRKVSKEQGKDDHDDDDCDHRNDCDNRSDGEAIKKRPQKQVVVDLRDVDTKTPQCSVDAKKSEYPIDRYRCCDDESEYSVDRYHCCEEETMPQKQTDRFKHVDTKNRPNTVAFPTRSSSTTTEKDDLSTKEDKNIQSHIISGLGGEKKQITRREASAIPVPVADPDGLQSRPKLQHVQSPPSPSPLPSPLPPQAAMNRMRQHLHPTSDRRPLKALPPPKRLKLPENAWIR